MKTLVTAVVAVAALLALPLVSAHDKEYKDKGRHGHERYDTRYDDDDDRYYVQDNYYGDNYYRYVPQPRYVQAKVVRVDRIGGYGDNYQRYCGTYPTNNNRSGINEGAVVGAVIGGLVGNQAASNQNRTAATLAGAAIGGLIGQSVDRNNGGNYDRQYVQCRSDWSQYQDRDVDYRVTYRYQDRYYTTIMPYHPGNKVQIRLDARPQAVSRVAYRY
jgi:uncharacterized protein YcfJ